MLKKFSSTTTLFFSCYGGIHRACREKKSTVCLTVTVQSIKSMSVTAIPKWWYSHLKLFKSRQTLHLRCAYCTLPPPNSCTQSAERKKDSERGSDLDVLKDQYIFTSAAPDYPLPHYITVISLCVYWNSVQGQIVLSVACLLDVTQLEAFNAHNTYGYGSMGSNQTRPYVSWMWRIWPQRGRKEDLVVFRCFKYNIYIQLCYDKCPLSANFLGFELWAALLNQGPPLAQSGQYCEHVAAPS